MFKIARKSLYFALLLICSTHAFADKTKWIHGDWELTHHPDENKQDILSFKQGSRLLATESSTRKVIEGMYAISNGSIKISLFNKGRIYKRFKLTFDERKNTLYYTSQYTDVVAHYTRKPWYDAVSSK